MLFDQARPTQLRRLRGAALRILYEDFGVQPDSMRLLRYEDNAVYSVQVGRDRYSLRLSIRDGRTEAEQRSEMAFLEAVRAQGRTTVPEPVPAVTGATVAVCVLEDLPEPCTAVLFRWIDGRVNPPYTRALARQLGVMTATFHEDAAAIALPADFTRPAWSVTELFENGAALNDRQAGAILGHGGVDTVRAVGGHLDGTLRHGGGKWGLIHADLHVENVIVAPGGHIAMIDFDDCGFGWSMLDVATIMASMCRRSDDRGYPALVRELVGGYEEIRHVPCSLDQIDDFLILRDVVIVNFVSASRNPTVAEWGPQRARGIVDGLRRWLDGEPYTGHFEG